VLSTAYRLRIQDICNRIVTQKEVSFEEMSWAEKLSKTNHVASRMLRQARRQAHNPEMTQNSLDGFLNALDLGPSDPNDKGIREFNTVDEIVDFFKRDNEDDWRRRD
jgi:hypothetical protein